MLDLSLTSDNIQLCHLTSGAAQLLLVLSRSSAIAPATESLLHVLDEPDNAPLSLCHLVHFVVISLLVKSISAERAEQQDQEQV